MMKLSKLYDILKIRGMRFYRLRFEKALKHITTRGDNEKFAYKITGKGIRLLDISKEIESSCRSQSYCYTFNP
jgi:hypothetical protein